MEVRFGGFCLSAGLYGEDMDGVLASVALDDFAVYEVGLKSLGRGGRTFFFCSVQVWVLLGSEFSTCHVVNFGCIRVVYLETMGEFLYRVIV